MSTADFKPYPLINGDRLPFQIDCEVSLIGIFDEQESTLKATTGEESSVLIKIKGLTDLGVFPNNSKVALIKGKVLSQN